MMPPLKFKRRNLTKKFERTPQMERLLYLDIVESQQMADNNGYLADTLLICDGGIIRVHAFLLQVASPLICDAIASQGENYPYIREILLPDFHVREIEKMLSLVYKGYVDLKNEKEVKSLRETLDFFQITKVNMCNNWQGEKIKEPLKVYDLNRIPQDLKSEKVEKVDDYEDEAVIVLDDDDIVEVPTNENENVKKKGKKNVSTSGSKVEKKTSGSDSSSEKNKKESSSDKNEALKQKPFVQLRRYDACRQQTNAKTTEASPTKTPIRPSGAKSTIIHSTAEEEEEPETDEEDKDWEPPSYTDKDWMFKESLRCQVCKKTYEKHGEALSCITSKHKALRCYFCFRVYSSTEILFRHFAKRHKQAAGREKTLMCNFCGSMVPWKSVSCHVISTHLKTKDKDSNKKDETKTNGFVHPPSTTVESEKSKVASRRSESREKESGPPPKKAKMAAEVPPTVTPLKNGSKQTSKSKRGKQNRKEKDKGDKPLKVPNLNFVLEKTTATGRRLVYQIQKIRQTDQ